MKIKELITESKTTGDCFQVAGRNMMDNPPPEMTLVHAYVSGQGPLKGKRYSHAWNEIGDVVIDYSNGRQIVMRKSQYYMLGQIEQKQGEYKKYDQKEALRHMVKYKHWGPWDLDPSKEKLK